MEALPCQLLLWLMAWNVFGMVAEIPSLSSASQLAAFPKMFVSLFPFWTKSQKVATVELNSIVLVSKNIIHFFALIVFRRSKKALCKTFL